MNKTKMLSVLLSASLVSSAFVMPITASADSSFTRYSGKDRYETAEIVAEKTWTSGTDNAILATGQNFADALCAGPLAKSLNAPILLTETNSLDAYALKALKDLKVKTVTIVGGTGAISKAVEDSLKTGFIVKRVSGADRFETSEQIAEKVLANNKSVSKVAVAYGLNYPDALSVAAPASAIGMPILLSDGSTLTDSEKKYIADNKIATSYVVGGAGVVKDTVLTQLPKGATRLAGATRFETNVKVLSTFASSLNFKNVFLAVGNGTTGREFADALSGSAAAAKVSAPLVLTDVVNSPLPTSTSNYLFTKVNTDTAVKVLGGIGAIADSTVNTFIEEVNVPSLTTLSLNCTDKTTVNGVITQPTANANIGLINLNLKTGAVFNGGSAKISKDLSEVKIVSTNLNQDHLATVKTTDDLASIIFADMKAAGYNPENGISASNIKYLLNGAVLTLKDVNGQVRTYSIIVTLN